MTLHVSYVSASFLGLGAAECRRVGALYTCVSSLVPVRTSVHRTFARGSNTMYRLPPRRHLSARCQIDYTRLLRAREIAGSPTPDTAVTAHRTPTTVDERARSARRVRRPNSGGA